VRTAQSKTFTQPDDPLLQSHEMHRQESFARGAKKAERDVK
jgi:hypothetical protein